MQVGSLALNLTIYLTDISRGHGQVQKGLKNHLELMLPAHVMVKRES